MSDDTQRDSAFESQAAESRTEGICPGPGELGAYQRRPDVAVGVDA